ncbi:MAG: hypothetical protein NVSMB14_14430 [Isosphaeraceae bacterium]
MTRLPKPRFDMLKMRHYAFGSVQFSRGCPFQCEFCDIIVTFGRKPRLKSVKQVITEIEALWKLGMRIVFIVDDNLIGNKRDIKTVLTEVAAWQKANGYPLSFFTEASIDLADEPELMELMIEANIVAVFIGIESPREDSLRETKKYQNVRSGGTMLEKVHRVQRAGIEVWCGMIIGFDHADSTIFDAQRDFIQQSRIGLSMTGMLHAIPKTPLHARLLAEGRLDPSDDPEFGSNVIPLQLGREELRDGYMEVLRDLYMPDAFFERVETLYIEEKIQLGAARRRYLNKHLLKRIKMDSIWLAQSAGLFLRLMRGVPEASLRKEYRKRLWRFLKVGQDPSTILMYVIQMAMHYHAHTLATAMTSGDRKRVVT